MNNKVAAYLRLSKEEFSNEKESNSITNQKLIIYNYLKEHKEYKLTGYYIDDASQAGCQRSSISRCTHSMPTLRSRSSPSSERYSSQ